jgi:FdrA protein
MQASAALQAVPGVTGALVAMGTELNLDLLTGMGFAAPEAGPDDLVIAIRAGDDQAAAAALGSLEAALAARPERSGAWDAPAPRTVGRAAAEIGADLALISVPGPNAFVEAEEALNEGLNVMIFSDNVAVEHEVLLKEQGADRGLLVMGPDCGTAIVGGVGLGFANAVLPGPVGLVGASGTGIQQLCCLLDDAGLGIRHALGTGSRDLSSRVGGAATIQALQALDRDPGTQVIVVVSKPPAPEVADRVRATAAGCATPTIFALVGERTLEAAAAETIAALGAAVPEPASWPSGTRRHRAGFLRGLFSGGTLRGEAAMVAASTLGPIGDTLDADGHTMVDLGGDEFTRGRPHPMIDHRLRLQYLEAAAAGAGVILLDVVLGHGAHPDPASELAPAIAGAVAAGAAVVVSLCGTAADPQGRDAQAALLHDAGASVFLSNAAAAAHAAALGGET